MKLSKVTYIWIDGATPTQAVRSKTKILKHLGKPFAPKDLPQWNFDGSSTNQASGHDSDLTLQPVCVVNDPIAGEGHYLALCEVLNPDGTPHPSNKRARLVQLMEHGGNAYDPWLGFEQEYTLFKGQQPLGWPDRGYPAPQGPFYCGVGSDEVFGRYLVDRHAQACIDAGIMIYGINAEVMPGQWEFQIGYRDIESEKADPITVCDHLWLARWLLYRLGEDYDINARLHPKPVKGDWNGAGKHTNFSTRETRDPKTGMDAINKAIKALEGRHKEHIAVYGSDLELRLTGKHETASIHEFIAGVGNRGASVRIPRPVAKKGYGYLEDRRPGANANPYEVAAILVETICHVVLPENKTETVGSR
jgi:glutamine synthetase